MDKTYFKFTITAFIIFLVIPFMLLADDESLNTAKIVTVKNSKIGIMPFMAGKFHTDIDDIVEKTISCSIEQLCFEPQDIKPDAEKNLTQYVTEFLELRLEPDALLPAHETVKAYTALYTDGNKEDMRSLAVRFGKKVNADYVLVGTVWRYRDRSQGTDEFERPASVAFVAYLVAVADGKRLWKGYYDKSQGALSDDISNAPLFFKGGAKWLTANEMAKIAVKETFEGFPFNLVKSVALNSKTVPK